MPDDDWALGQNEVDVRNEARKARSGLTEPSGVEGGRVTPDGVGASVGTRASLGSVSPSVFVCHDPEQAWIDESRAEAEREED